MEPSLNGIRVLSHFFREGLRGAADTDHDGRTTWSELVRYIHDTVPVYVKGNIENCVQTPEVMGETPDFVVGHVKRNGLPAAAADSAAKQAGASGGRAVSPVKSDEPRAGDGRDKVSDSRYGIALAVPKPWLRAIPGDFTVSGAERFAWSAKGDSCLVVFVREPDAANTPRDMLAAIATAKKDDLGVEVLTQEVRTVAGMRAAWLVLKGKGTGNSIDGVGDTDTVDHWVAVPRQKDTVVVLLTCPAADYDEAKKSFEEVIGSLELSGSQTKEQSESK